MLRKTSSGSELLLRGAEKYLDALAAIEAFKGEVQKACTEVYERYRAQLAAQLGLEDVEPETHEHYDAEAQLAELGVQRPAGRESKFYLYLKWNETEDSKVSINACLCLALYWKRLRDEIYEQLCGGSRRCPIKKRETRTFDLNLETPVKPEEIGSVIPQSRGRGPNRSLRWRLSNALNLRAEPRLKGAVWRFHRYLRPGAPGSARPRREVA